MKYPLLSHVVYFAGKVCAEYNSVGMIIQRNSNATCKECPSVYSSPNSFLCKYLHKDFLLWVLF